MNNCQVSIDEGRDILLIVYERVFYRGMPTGGKRFVMGIGMWSRFRYGVARGRASCRGL